MLQNLPTGIYPTIEIRELRNYLDTNITYHPDNTLPIGMSDEQKEVHVASVSKYRTELQKYDKLVLELIENTEVENDDTVQRRVQTEIDKTKFTDEITKLVNLQIEQLKSQCSDEMITHSYFTAWIDRQRALLIQKYWLA